MIGALYSSDAQLDRIRAILQTYARLPFAETSIPGRIMESVLSVVREGEVLPTYDFVDVIRKDIGCGWQVKSTRKETSVTWKRAKIPNAEELIADSQKSLEARQILGDAIIEFCNEHALESIEEYGLHAIGYARLISFPREMRALYFERQLCSREDPKVFRSEDFEWRWSPPRSKASKEMLPALNGVHKASGKKWFAWHGRGENQLHFSGESVWWPENDRHSRSFQLPGGGERLSWNEVIELLSRAT